MKSACIYTSAFKKTLIVNLVVTMDLSSCIFTYQQFLLSIQPTYCSHENIIHTQYIIIILEIDSVSLQYYSQLYSLIHLA